MVGVVEELPCLRDLIAVLIECFLIISLGYLSVRFKLISSEAKDLNSYLTTFALPMIIFLNIAQMEIQNINLGFLICVLTAKLLVFASVALLTFVISYPSNFGYAGSLAILTTQSSDFALGYPLIKSLYGDQKQEMLSYLSLMAPIQLLILNPIGIVMLEYNKTKTKRALKAIERSETSSCQLCRPNNSPETSKYESVCVSEKKSRRSSLPVTGFSPSFSMPISKRSSTTEEVRHRAVGITLRGQASTSCFKSIDYKTNQDYVQPYIVKSMAFRSQPSTMQNRPDEANLSDCEESINILIGNNQDFKLTQEHPSTSYNVSHNYNSIRHSPVSSIPASFKALSTSAHNESAIQPNSTCKCASNNQTNQSPSVNLSFLKSLAINPLIISSILACLVNVIHGPELPKFVTKVCNSLAASFAAPALFVVGVSMYGKFDLIRRNPDDLMLSSVLALTKILLLPNLMRTLALVILPYYAPIEEVHYLVDFAFLYGTLPTAPTACIIANQYGMLSNVVSLSMLLSTFMSTPLILASSVIINPATEIKTSVIESVISQTMKISSLLTLGLTSLTLYASWKLRRDISYTSFVNIPVVAVKSLRKITKNPAHVFLLLLAFSQTIMGLGGFIWFFVEDSKSEPPSQPPQYETSIIKSFSLAALTNNQKDTEQITLANAQTFDDIKLTSSSNMMNGIDPTPITHNPLMTNQLSPSNLDLVSPSSVTLKDSSESLIFSESSPGFSMNILSLLQYIFSSYGLIMARFVVLSMIISLAANRLKGQTFASKLSILLVKLYVFIGIVVVIWSISDSQRLEYQPAEASLPGNRVSLYLRLIYNTLFLIISVPIFAWLIRSNNLENNNKRSNKSSEAPNNQDCCFTNQRFVTSNASLSSDASSAITANTNLDSSNYSNSAQLPQDSNNNNIGNNNNSSIHDGASILLDSGSLDMVKRSSSPLSDVNSVIFISSNNEHANLDDDPTFGQETSSIPPNNTYTLTSALHIVQSMEFNKYSMLIVYMLIDSLHNLITITQKLLQAKPYGTFRQIEVANVAMEFGQGLTTFLIYRMRGLFY